MRIAVRSIVCLWVATAAVSTWAAGDRFDDDVTLFGPEVGSDPTFLEGHAYLGDAYRDRDDFDRASRHYESALEFRSDRIAYVDWVAVSVNLAEIRLRAQRLDEADALLVRAQSAASVSLRPKVLYNRALVAVDRQDYEAAARFLGQVDSWERPEPYLLESQVLRRLGRTDEALLSLRRSLPLLRTDRREAVQKLIDSVTKQSTPERSR